LSNVPKCDNIIYRKGILHTNFIGGVNMREEYKKLNKLKLNNRPHRTISTEEALSQVTPMQFIEDVYNGTAKVQIDKKGINYVSTR
jgi:hypothetical protein